MEVLACVYCERHGRVLGQLCKVHELMLLENLDNFIDEVLNSDHVLLNHDSLLELHNLNC